MNSQKGFTIIETLIALSIGGLMLTLVFLILPILIRSNENNQRSQDVITVLQSVSDYRLRNLGGFPSGVTSDSTDTSSDTLHLTGKYRLTYYDAQNVKLNADFSPTDNDSISIKNYYRCSGNIADANGAGSRDIVALYRINTGSGYADKCASL